MGKEKAIKISEATDKKLSDMGKFGESYDGVINRVIDENEKCSIKKPVEKKEEVDEKPKETPEDKTEE